MHTHLKVTAIFSSFLALGLWGSPKLQCTRVDVETTQFSGQGGWNQLIILRANEELKLEYDTLAQWAKALIIMNLF